MVINRSYTGEIRKELDYSATWFPNDIICPGMVVTLKDHQLNVITNLDNLGIPFSTGPGAYPADTAYSSLHGVRITSKAAGAAPLQGSALTQMDAGVSVEFDRENAIVFHLLNCTSQRITDQVSLEKEVIRRYNSGDWDKSWVIITEVVETKKGTIMIASRRNARIEITFRGKIEGNLANISTNHNIVQNVDVNEHWIARRGLTPMFRAYGIAKEFFERHPHLKEFPPKGSVPDFSQLDYDDFTD